MKLYTPPPPITIVRVIIVKDGGYDNAEYINLCDTTKEEVGEVFRKILSEQKVSPFIKGKKTSITIREYKDKKNGKGFSISLYGITPLEAKNLFLNYLTNQQVCADQNSISGL
jgi:hypothetical protein